jgi:hypothetical protein
VTSEALAEYLASTGDGSADVLTALDAAILRAHAQFDVAVKYRMVMYTLDRDWRHWVCAIGAAKNGGASVRFLYGAILDDPKDVLRAGTSILMTWDVAGGEKVDPRGVGAYVKEAVAKHAYFKEHEREITAAAKGARQ